MSRDHLEAIRLTEELEALRRVLYGLYAIIKLHLAKEEEIYAPLLEARLPPEEVDHLVQAMERTVAEAKASLKMLEPHE